MKFLCHSVFYLLILGLPPAFGATVDEVIAATQAPEGVVFEIVSSNDDLLRSLMPKVVKKIERLRKRFPDLPIAVVTHGTEQFALMSNHRAAEPRLHALVQTLVSEQHIDVHVCGTYAERHGFSPEDFPDYVNVSAEGPAQINDYRALGYVVIKLPW
jgi:intracellular sulfur oxidation DsrE/DsrF family protein